MERQLCRVPPEDEHLLLEDPEPQVLTIVRWASFQPFGVRGCSSWKTPIRCGFGLAAAAV